MWLIQVAVLERALAQTRMVSLTKIKLWLLPVLMKTLHKIPTQLAAVKEGCKVKARTDCEVIRPRDYASTIGKPKLCMLR